MATILILYGSSHGQTREVAAAIANRLRKHGLETELADASCRGCPSPTDYDAIVIGSRIQFQSVSRDVLAYTREYQPDLDEMPSFLFTVSCAAASKPGMEDPNGYLAKVAQRTGWKPKRSAAIAGALPYRDYDWLTRWIMKLIAGRTGLSTDTSKNHVFTDWTQVERFADDIAHDIEPEVIGYASAHL